MYNRQLLEKAVSRRLVDEETLKQRESRLDALLHEKEVLLKSQALVQEVAKEVQSQLSLKLSNIVNLGISTCFPGYGFEVVYITSRGKTEVQFVVKDGDTPIDVMNQNGGGFVDVIAFCLRLAVYSISNVSNVMILDEPFRFISKGLRMKIADLVSLLSEKLGLQIIEVTHVKEFSDNSTSFLIKKENGVSNVYKD